MSKANHDRDALDTRFRANMGESGAIAKLLHSDVESLKQTDLFRSEGVRADILRAVVVFLHATVEDFIRSHLPRPNKTFTFSSASDIKKVLNRLRSIPPCSRTYFRRLRRWQSDETRSFIMPISTMNKVKRLTLGALPMNGNSFNGISQPWHSIIGSGELQAPLT